MCERGKLKKSKMLIRNENTATHKSLAIFLKDHIQHFKNDSSVWISTLQNACRIGSTRSDFHYQKIKDPWKAGGAQLNGSKELGRRQP